MKRILAVVLTFAMLLSLSGVVTAAEEAAVSTDGLVLQDLSYDEVLHRVSQGDSGFTISSTAIYAHHLEETSEPRNDSGFQFYYISLSAYSGSFDNYEDKEIDQWFLDYLDESLANLQANGGGCMIRATYGLDGQQNCEPTDFNVLLGHVEQLAGVFAKYPDVVTTVECGMIGAFGEMWGGLYSDSDHKAQVLDAWLTYLPDEISVNVRTANEYIYYVNNSEVFINNYKGQTVNDVTYPDSLGELNYWSYTFPGTDFARISVYNDAMLQDGNDGGTFPYRDWDADGVGAQQRDGFAQFLSNQSGMANYGGEFSGETGEVYRYKLSYWMPMNAIPVLFASNLSYYHGGNAAYQNLYKKFQTINRTWTEDLAAVREETLAQNISDAGLGMTYSVVKDADKVKVKYPDGTYSAQLTYDEAVVLLDEYNAGLEEGADQAVLAYAYAVTTGGWDSATANEALFTAIKNRVDVTADIDDYLGQSASKYFEDHVGYRIVLRESNISGEVVPGGTLKVSGAVDNTGFANITKNKVVELVLSNGTDTYVISTDIDANSWKSAQRSTYSASVALPADLAVGEYSVFMRVANQDASGNTVAASAIAFANAGDYTYTTPASSYGAGAESFASCYSSEMNGNYIGTVSVVADSYEITFANEDGTVLQTVVVDNGETPVYTGETPVKDGGDDCCYYVFAGWDNEITAATDNTTYTATYGDAVAHDYEWVTDVAPDLGIAGSETGTCSECGETITREIPALYFEQGDVNGDEVLNVLDMTLTAQYIAQKGVEGKFDLSACYLEMMDANEDGKIDQRDLNYIAAIVRAQ